MDTIEITRPIPRTITKLNKAIVDHTSPALHIPNTPSRPIHLQRTRYNALSMGRNPQNCRFSWDFVTVPEQDRTTAIGKATCTEKLVKISRVVPEISWWIDRQTHRQTDVLTTILRYRSRRRSNETVNERGGNDAIQRVRNICSSQ